MGVCIIQVINIKLKPNMSFFMNSQITNELHLSGCPKHVGSFDRENIFYKVKYKDGIDDPLQDLIKYVERRHSECEKQGRLCSGIIYCHKRDDTSMLAHALSRKAGVTAKPYHAGLKKDERNNVQELWSTNEVQVAVATVSRNDVRQLCETQNLTALSCAHRLFHQICVTL
jgi:superfamily II DNA helicase RecQ